MPLKLIPPREGKSPNWTIRGTYLGRYVERSTGTGKRAIAVQALKEVERKIESGQFSHRNEPTFAAAAAKYMRAGGERAYMKPLLQRFRAMPLSEFNQSVIDAAAEALYPNATPATRNRQVYTPVCAVLRDAGEPLANLRRPKRSAGGKQTNWLWPEQAFALFEEAHKQDPEFAALLITLCYTGLRLSEALDHETAWRIADAFAYVPDTKNGDPSAVFLPPVVVATLANLDKWNGFRFAKGGHLYSVLRAVAFRAGVDLPRRSAFHILRHTYATWMRRYGKADLQGLLSTDRWKDPKSVQRYTHVVVSEEAQRAIDLPTPRGKSVA